MKKNKYHARKVVIDGEEFHSESEARWFQNLKLIQRARAISGLERQVEMELRGAGGNVVASLILDAVWIDAEGVRQYADFKGMETPISRLKRKLFEDNYGQPIRIFTSEGEQEYDRAGRRKRRTAKRPSHNGQKVRHGARTVRGHGAESVQRGEA